MRTRTATWFGPVGFPSTPALPSVPANAPDWSNIEDSLDQGLPEAFTPELYEQKVEAVYQHVYDACYGKDTGIYTALKSLWRDGTTHVLVPVARRV